MSGKSGASVGSERPARLPSGAMTELAEIAPSFVEMAHRIVWCTVATTGSDGRPNTRVLHPVW